MKLYKLIDYTCGIDMGYSGIYTYFCVWCHPRFSPGGLHLEFRLYDTKWWKTYKDNKNKITWQGKMIDIKGL